MQQIAGNKEPEAFTTCPYNPAHRVPLFRMKRHLVKCRMSYPDSVIVTCPLNIEHRVPQPELSYHVERCPDILTVDRKIQIPEVIDQKLKIEVPILDLTTDECWDDAENASYDPKKNALKKPVLRILNCESKAKRRDFREEERNRIVRINVDTATSTTKAAKAYKPMDGQSLGTPCRRPFTQSAFASGKRPEDLDPYKVNDILQALDHDQKRLLDNLQTMGDNEELVIFPIEEKVVESNNAEGEDVKKSSVRSPRSDRSAARGRYATVLYGNGRSN